MQGAHGLGQACGVLRAHTAVFLRREQEAVAAIAAPRSHRDFRAPRAPAPAASGSTTPLVTLLDPPGAQTPARVGVSSPGAAAVEVQHGRGGFVCAVGKGKR